MSPKTSQELRKLPYTSVMESQVWMSVMIVVSDVSVLSVVYISRGSCITYPIDLLYKSKEAHMPLYISHSWRVQEEESQPPI